MLISVIFFQGFCILALKCHICLLLDFDYFISVIPTFAKGIYFITLANPPWDESLQFSRNLDRTWVRVVWVDNSCNLRKRNLTINFCKSQTKKNWEMPYFRIWVRVIWKPLFFHLPLPLLTRQWLTRQWNLPCWITITIKAIVQWLWDSMKDRRWMHWIF